MKKKRVLQTGPAATVRAKRVAKATETLPPVADGRDPRRDRTRLALLEAYVALCRENGNESAGVAAICRRARVNKSTFYRHFEDRDDLLDRGLEAFFASIGDRIDPPTVEEGRTAASALRRIEVLFKAIEEHAGLMRPIVSGSAGSVLRQKAESFCEEYIEARRVARLARPDDKFTLPRAAIPRALVSLCLGLASWWLDHPGACSAKEMAGHYLAFIAAGLFTGREESPPAR